MAIKVQWDISGKGELELFDDYNGESDEEIREWVEETIATEVHECGDFKITTSGLAEAIKELRAKSDE